MPEGFVGDDQLGTTITVVTPTWQRHNTIADTAIPGVWSQDYPHELIEHLVVVDGHDPRTVTVLRDHGYAFDDPHRRMTYLGRNWTSYSADGGLGLTARLVGAWMARGDYIAYMDDDVQWMPHHLSALAALLEWEGGVDFVTGSWILNGQRGGDAPPGECRTDTSAIMCRAATLKKGGSWCLDGGHGEGLLVQRWIDAGCTWRHKMEATYNIPARRNGHPDW